MKLLFDENLSRHLVPLLRDLYPDSVHVCDIGLERADDRDLWNYAVKAGVTIVTKDGDLHQLSFLYGHPPKIIWLRIGNCSTKDVEKLLRARYNDVIVFDNNPESSLLALS